MGPELYNEIHRLICEWRGLDSKDQTAAIPRLVEQLARLKAISSEQVARAATEGSEALIVLPTAEAA